MNVMTAVRAASDTTTVEHFDVLIVGAGISGIGSAYQLTKQLPDRSFVILESQDSFGGTWLTHRYPGIRSDSDLHTFGYSFKPWVGPPIATAEEIKSYMGDVIAENDLARHIRYKHRIERASWSSETNLWTVEAVRTDSDEPVTFTANFLWMCQGYYRHSEGYTPDWKDMDKFKGRIVHPQALARGYRPQGQDRGRDRLGRHRRDPDPRDRGQLRARHHAAALADLFSDRPQRHRARRDLAAAAGQGGVDPRDRPPQDPVRAGRVHQALPRRAGAGQEGADRPDLGDPRSRLRRRDAFHAELPAVAAAHRLRARCRPVPWHQERQGLRRHRRDRPLHRERHPAEIRPRARGRYHRHRDRLQPLHARRHRLRYRRPSRSISATP